jgi:hypothetical protein
MFIPHLYLGEAENRVTTEAEIRAVIYDGRIMISDSPFVRRVQEWPRGIKMVGEMQPDEADPVTLSDDLDQYGLRVARITYKPALTIQTMRCGRHRGLASWPAVANVEADAAGRVRTKLG